MKSNIDNVTDVWTEYEKGKEYNYMQNLYEKSKKNFDFYHGNQWQGLKLTGMQPITLNIIKSIVKYKVGVVKTNTYEVFFNSDTYENQEEREKLQDICEMLNRYVSRMWEKNNINKIIRSCINDSCIDSEGIIYFYTDDDENSNTIYAEQVNRTNVYYGNENEDDIQKQPYIIISFRKTVDEVRAEAKANGLGKDELELIVQDNDIEEQSGRDKMTEEISPMCLVLLKLYKKDGMVYATKCTKNVQIMEETPLEINRYPVAHMVWERVKGSARGQGEVEYLIPNQIEINKTATRRAIIVKLLAYPKMVYNSKYISNPKSITQIGTAIALKEMNADDVNKVVNYLRPAPISSDALQLQKELEDDSKALAGANDTVTGNIDPTQASGKSILAVQQATQQPINEQVEAYKDFVEDIARIWYEMIKANSVKGITLTKEIKDYTNDTTNEEIYTISQKELASYDLDIRVDVTPKSPFDKFAMEMSLENLLKAGYITIDEFVDALPNDSAMPKSKLKAILKDREEKAQVINELQRQGNELQGAMQQVMTEQEMMNAEQTGVNPMEANLVNEQ